MLKLVNTSYLKDVGLMEVEDRGDCVAPDSTDCTKCDGKKGCLVKCDGTKLKCKRTGQYGPNDDGTECKSAVAYKCNFE